MGGAGGSVRALFGHYVRGWRESVGVEETDREETVNEGSQGWRRAHGAVCCVRRHAECGTAVCKFRRRMPPPHPPSSTRAALPRAASGVAGGAAGVILSTVNVGHKLAHHWDLAVVVAVRNIRVGDNAVTT